MTSLNLDSNSSARSKYNDSVDYSDEDAFMFKCEELVEHFKSRTVEALIKCTKLSLDLIKRR